MNFQQMYKEFQVSLLFLQHTYIPQVGGFRSLTAAIDYLAKFLLFAEMVKAYLQVNFCVRS